VQQDLPMLLSIMREWRKKRLGLRQVREILSSVENFHFIFTAVTSQRSSGGISAMYASHARRLGEANSLEDRLKVLRELQQKLGAKLPPEDEFVANFREILYSRTFSKQKKLVQYILARIDQEARRKAHDGTMVDYGNMTIEHITPESYEGDEDVPDHAVAMLGNLLLVDPPLNEKLKDRPFPQKLEILHRSSVPLDDIIINATRWDAGAIATRTDLLARRAYQELRRM